MKQFKYNDRLYHCSFTLAIDLVSGKWKGLILKFLLDGTLRYGELKKLMPGITQKMLTQTLRALEKDGLIHREVYAVVPPKVEYSLTEIGRGVGPVLKMLHIWGEEIAEVLVVDDDVDMLEA